MNRVWQSAQAARIGRASGSWPRTSSRCDRARGSGSRARPSARALHPRRWRLRRSAAAPSRWENGRDPPAPRVVRNRGRYGQDGRDLEIFAYSNESIIERARFHQLSAEEGQKIAYYIRSLSARHDDVGRWGRPWNPPYQPGPSVADRPVQEWAAGAGLEAVLEEDSDMLGAMFPDGVKRQPSPTAHTHEFAQTQ